MLDIRIKTIPHKKHRFETVGDYWSDHAWRRWEFRVSDLGNWKWEALVALHELVEACLLRAAGIPEPIVKAFDEQFELERKMGQHSELAESGDHPDAPYHLQHVAATGIEKLFAVLLGVKWADYEAYLTGL